MEDTRVMNNFAWKFAERFGTQAISFLVSIVLARLLDPEAYGKIATVTVFICILSVFCDSGLGNALIQKTDADDLDFSTVFYYNLLLSGLLCVFLFLAAPYIALYYEDNELIPLIRCLSFSLPLYGIRNVQQAYVSKNMLFKRFFYSTLSGTIVSAIAGICTALMGGGAWSLVVMQLSLQFTDTMVLWITVSWKPIAKFSRERLRKLFAYGGRLLASGIMETVYSSLRSIIIGKKYSQESLAFYSKGRSLPDLIGTNINNSIETVMFPVLSKEQKSKENIKLLTRKTIKISTFVLFPCLLGFIGVADTLIVTIYGEKWASAIPYLRLFCVYFLLFPFHTSNLNAIKALGRSDIILKQEIIKKIMGICILMISFRYGVLAMALSLVIEGFLGHIINTWPNRSLISYGYIAQVVEVIPTLILSIVMCIAVYFLHFLPFINVVNLIIQIIFGVCIYVAGAKFVDRESYDYLLGFVKKIIKRDKRENISEVEK